jgi:hypothetical protein
MAWTEQCKIDASQQVEHLKEKGLTVKEALEKLSAESGIRQSDFTSKPNSAIFIVQGGQRYGRTIAAFSSGQYGCTIKEVDYGRKSARAAKRFGRLVGFH